MTHRKPSQVFGFLRAAFAFTAAATSALAVADTPTDVIPAAWAPCIAAAQSQTPAGHTRRGLRVDVAEGNLQLTNVFCEGAASQEIEQAAPQRVDDRVRPVIIAGAAPGALPAQAQPPQTTTPRADISVSVVEPAASSAPTAATAPTAPTAADGTVRTPVAQVSRSGGLQANAQGWNSSVPSGLDHRTRYLPTSNPPVIQTIGDKNATVAQQLAFTVTATDSDGPAPLVITLRSSTPALPAGVSFTDNGDGSANFTWTPQPGDVGTYLVEFRARDDGGAGSLSEQTITITVTANQAPQIDEIVDRNVVARTPLSFAVSSSDADGPAPIALSIASSIPTLPSSAVLTDFGDGSGSFDWTPANADEGSYAVTVRATDGAGAFTEESFTIVVQDNAPPTLSSIAPVTVMRGSTISFNVNATDNDGPAPIDLSIASSTPSLPPAASFTDNGNGTGSFSWTTVAGDAGTYTVTFRATDENGAGEFAEVSTTLTVYSTGGDTVQLPFLDNFSDGNLNGWVPVDDVPIASNWTVTGGQAHETERLISVLGFDETYMLGSFLALTGGAALTDYTVSARLEFLAEDQQADIGLMFRYVSPTNYYRLSFNSARSFTRLEKQVNGTFSTLAVNARGYKRDEVLNVEVRVSGDDIEVDINGDTVFAVTDSDIGSGSVALFCAHESRFDDVLITAIDSAPSVALSSPLAYIGDENTTINAQAMVRNAPAGARVDFVLNGNVTISDTSAPYSATFTSVPNGNHTVEAILRNAQNQELDRDTNQFVGAGGSRIASIGDSITQGSGDLYYADNISTLERVIGSQSFQASLTDLLDDSTSPANVVFNEGIGGDRSDDTAFERVDSILSRHPEMDTALVMLGTNDTLAAMPSGMGCSGAACNGTYKGNMQTLIDKLRWANYPTNTVPSGIQILVAEPPPVFAGTNPWNSSTNNRLRDYNTVITSELTGTTAGPDFFSYFMPNASSNYESLFQDDYHPNSLGYEVMAALWHNALASPVALPFVLDDLDSSAAFDPKQDLMQAGNAFQADTSHTLSAVPALLQDGRWLVVNNADYTSTSSSYLTFDTDRAVTVYVAFDGGASSRPTWMNGFTDTGQNINTSHPSAPWYDLFSRTYAAGTVTLGGASASGAAGVNANMIVIVVEN